MLLRPERAHAEQLMNSQFLSAMDCGAFALLEEVTRDRVRSFVDEAGRFAPALAALAGRMDGTPEVLRVIEHRLAAGAAAPKG